MSRHLLSLWSMKETHIGTFAFFKGSNNPIANRIPITRSFCVTWSPAHVHQLQEAPQMPPGSWSCLVVHPGAAASQVEPCGHPRVTLVTIPCVKQSKSLLPITAAEVQPQIRLCCWWQGQKPPAAEADGRLGAVTPYTSTIKSDKAHLLVPRALAGLELNWELWITAQATSKRFLVVSPETCRLFPTLNNMWLPLTTDSKLIAQLKGILPFWPWAAKFQIPQTFLESIITLLFLESSNKCKEKQVMHLKTLWSCWFYKC